MPLEQTFCLNHPFSVWVTVTVMYRDPETMAVSCGWPADLPSPLSGLLSSHPHCLACCPPIPTVWPAVLPSPLSGLLSSHPYTFFLSPRSLQWREYLKTHNHHPTSPVDCTTWKSHCLHQNSCAWLSAISNNNPIQKVLASMQWQSEKLCQRRGKIQILGNLAYTGFP